MARLENVSADELRAVLAGLDDADAAIRVMAAITYKEVDGLTQREIAEMYGFSTGWVSKWFRRLELLEGRPPEDVVSDRPRSGRPPELTASERRQFENALHEHPRRVGIDAPGWTVPLAREYLHDTFGVEYSTRHVRRLMLEAGMTWESVSGDHPRGTQETSPRSRTIWYPRESHDSPV